MSDGRPTLDQRRARHAWYAVERVKTLADAGDVDAGDFAREVKRLPVRIRSAGLGQALAFLNAKSAKSGEDARAQILLDLGDWLLTQRDLGPVDGTIDKTSVFCIIIKGDANLLRWATGETMAYLQWLGRFSEAQIDWAGD